MDKICSVHLLTYFNNYVFKLFNQVVEAVGLNKTILNDLCTNHYESFHAVPTHLLTSMR